MYLFYTKEEAAYLICFLLQPRPSERTTKQIKNHQQLFKLAEPHGLQIPLPYAQCSAGSPVPPPEDTGDANDKRGCLSRNGDPLPQSNKSHDANCEIYKCDSCSYVHR